jgi:hypothetical protein
MADNEVTVVVKEKKPRKPRAPKAPKVEAKAKAEAPSETKAVASEAKTEVPAAAPEPKKAPAKRAAAKPKSEPLNEQLDRRHNMCKFVDSALDHCQVLLDNPLLGFYQSACVTLDCVETHRKRLEDEVELLTRKKLEPTGHDLGKLCDKLNAVELQATKILAKLRATQSEAMAKDPKSWTPLEKTLVEEHFIPKKNDYDGHRRANGFVSMYNSF